MLDRAGIGRLIPQSGPMVLLDRVVSHDETDILCTTLSHRRVDNPLSRDGRIPTVCGAEYGAQAAAVHGPLVEGQAMRPGQIVLLREMIWNRPYLSDIQGPLEVRAHCIHRDARGLAYRFVLSADDVEVLSGECGIILS